MFEWNAQGMRAGLPHTLQSAKRLCEQHNTVCETARSPVQLSDTYSTHRWTTASLGGGNTLKNRNDKKGKNDLRGQQIEYEYRFRLKYSRLEKLDDRMTRKSRIEASSRQEQKKRALKLTLDPRRARVLGQRRRLPSMLLKS
jgi:hypothetical protein